MKPELRADWAKSNEKACILAGIICNRHTGNKNTVVEPRAQQLIKDKDKINYCW